jgi:hypothetical protein
MTELPFDDDTPVGADAPLEPPMLELVRNATDVPDDAVPRDMMWARIRQQRAASGVRAAGVIQDGAVADARQTVRASSFAGPGVSRWLVAVRVAGIAAVLVGGIGVGRYLMPATGPSKYQLAIAQSSARADSVTALGLGPDALAALPADNDPAHVAMAEHLTKTVALLTSVRDEDPARGPGNQMIGVARELLSTTRLLLDEPQLRDERTRRLLQDLELVLVQIVQARGSAPETKRAPSETMRETNLLPRVRAASTAARRGDEGTLGGGEL